MSGYGLVAFLMHQYFGGVQLHTRTKPMKRIGIRELAHRGLLREIVQSW
jgi:hypothetical protein